MSKIIMHIDLNAFFARAEVLKDPSLAGKPLVVGSASRRGIVSTASYEARKYGIHSAMPMYMAKRLCPQLIIKNVDGHYYHQLSNQFFAFLRGYSLIQEVASIDECYMDMSKPMRNIADPVAYLKQLQDHLLAETGLQCSIGLAPTKFLAKMASDFKKPMGITILRRRDIEKLLWPLPIKAMYGVGKKTYPRLEKLGIKTIGDLAKTDDIRVKKTLGKFFFVLQDWANGRGSDEVSIDDYEPKSIGHSTTFLDDVDDFEEIAGMLKTLCLEVSERAQKEEQFGTTIQLTIKNADFSSITRSMTLENPINDPNTIYNAAMSLLEKNYHNQPIRLVGVSLHNLESRENIIIQMSIFDHAQHEEQSRTRLLIDELNRKLEKPILMTADQLKKDKK
ncbi:MAG: DNA polymerase IV [Bacilli bacterium]|nr:DNA polymerase IV [Bacilli bacterium]MDD3388839.1 DNA polymerase IV [Bacilli bacterium]MDD4345010.1 DNA polymerase IV [Bacilli bacterium]MDD4520519.1 DNA polymerase IV [Bacilli bacterium]MDY0399207.1 DNA polymerase IV [Bacilli bacterium]